MEKDILVGEIGSVGKYELELKDGKLVAKASALASVVEMEASVRLDGEAVIRLVQKAVKEKVLSKIPGSLDETAFDMAIEKLISELKA